MELNRPPILTVSNSEGKEFEKECAQLYEADYKMVSSSCGVARLDGHEYNAYFQAVFVDRSLDV